MKTRNTMMFPDYEIENVSVVDGDTLKVKLKHIVSVRLSRIDTPERSNKEKWEQAKEYVKERIHNAKQIKLTVTSQGKYGRYLAEVFVDGVNLNNELVEKGMAVKYEPRKNRKTR